MVVYGPWQTASQRAMRVTRGIGKKKKGNTSKNVSQFKELVVENSTYNSSFDINKISVFEKENTVFTDSKDRQVKHYYPIKKLWLLELDLA